MSSQVGIGSAFGLGLRWLCCAAVCVGNWGMAVAQHTPSAQPGGRETGETLVALAEGFNRNLAVVAPPQGVPPLPSGQPAQFSRLEDAARALGLEARTLDGVTWLGTPTQGPLLLGTRTFLTQEEQREAAALDSALGHLGSAVLGSLSDEQMYNLRLGPRPEEVVQVFASYEQARQRMDAASAAGWFRGQVPPPFLNIGGCVTGDEMTEFQRSLCLLAFYCGAKWYPLEWLRQAHAVALGDFQVEMARGREMIISAQFLADVCVVNRKQNATTADMRFRGQSHGALPLPITLEGRMRVGAELEELVAWARSNAVLERPGEWLPPPRCEHTTDGPTRDVTQLLTQEEAGLTLSFPADIGGRPVEEVVAGFRQAGIEIVYPISGGARVRGAGRPVPGEIEGITLLEFLNTDLRRNPHAYWRREGNRFTLVWQHELSGAYSSDPARLLPAGAADRPVTLTAADVSPSDILARLREATGAPIFGDEIVAASSAQVSLRVVDVPLGSLLRALGEYLGGVWQKRENGEVFLVARARLQEEDPSAWQPLGDELQSRVLQAAGMCASLLLDSLSAEERNRLRSEAVEAGSLPPVPRALAMAAAALAFQASLEEGEAVAVGPVRESEQGESQIDIGLHGKAAHVTALPPLTVPPTRPVGPLLGLLSTPWFGPPPAEEGGPPLPR